ncbi:MAG: GGDEF domain-containing protein [Burkholderiaceae bacterium]|nr:GGDEF domain-containing protein [Burkholderiaceae bacterium]
MITSEIALPSAAERARSALRYLAQRRLSPTPDQYRRAWERVGGNGPDDEHADAGESEPARSAEPRHVDGCESAPLGPVVAEAMHWVEIPQRNWTRARKKEALQRVLSRPSDAARLVGRLSSLVDSWKRDEGDRCANSAGGSVTDRADFAAAGNLPPPPPADGSAASSLAQPPTSPAVDETASAAADASTSPAADRSTPAADKPISAAAGDPADRPDEQASAAQAHADTARRLLDEMTRLLVTICETVPTLVEEEAWVRRQFDTIRATLEPSGRFPDRRDLALARDVLRRTAEEHQRLLQLRRDSLQMMKSMLAQCVDWLGALTASSGRFGDKLGTYMENIRKSPDLATLAGVVHELIDETRSVYVEFDASRNDFAAAGERARQLQDEVERLAGELDNASALVMTDHLTRLLNRRGLERSFDDLSRDCRNAAAPLSLALIDVDDFKRLNDAFGHQKGDEALRHLARVLSGSLRPTDVVARYGGEEFVVLLPSVPVDHALEVIRRAQRALTNNVYLNGDERVFVTFSAGVAQSDGSESLDAIVERADEAMYRAKRAGKNRVFAATR